MAENNENNTSIIPVDSNSIVRVGNAIELINRLLAKESVRMVPFRVGDYWYVYNLDSKSIISEFFDLIQFIDNSTKKSKALLIANEKRFAILNEPRELSSLIWYDDLKPIAVDKMKMIVSKEGSFGIIEASGKILEPFTYDKIIDKLRFRNASSDGFLIVNKNSKYGIIALDSLLNILPVEYDIIEETGNVHGDNILKVRKANNIGVFDCRLKTLLFLAEFDDVWWCNEGICSVSINSKLALYDFQLNKLINQSEYDSINFFTNGYAICFKKNLGFFTVDKFGRESKIKLNNNHESLGNINRFNDVLIVKDVERVKRNNDIGRFFDTTFRFHIYVRFNFIFTIEHKERARHTGVRVKNDLIEITEAGKYGGSLAVRFFDFIGKEISKQDILNFENDNSEISTDIISISNFMTTSVSEWKINYHQLYYKDELFYEISEGELEADLTLVFPKLDVILDSDPEFGVIGYTLGYLDQNGNMFWRD
jgi:hypothetical protein